MKAVAPLTDMQQAVMQWQRELAQEGHLSAGTVTKYATNVERCGQLAAARGALTWRDVDRSTVLAYVSDGKASPSTRRNRLLSVRAFYRWSQMPDPSAGIRAARREQRLPRSLAPEAVQAMIDACEDGTWYGVRDRALLELAISTGARADELMRLTLADLSLERGTVRLFGKGSRERVGHLTETARAALRAWLQARSRAIPQSEPHLFVSQALTRFSAMGLWRVFVRRGEQAGVATRVNPHLFRHSFATQMLRGGADLRTIQQLMGHRSIATTQVYLNADDAWVKREHERCHPRATEGPAHEGSEAVSLGRMPGASRAKPRRTAVRVPPPAGEAHAPAPLARQAEGARGAGAQERAGAGAKGRR